MDAITFANDNGYPICEEVTSVSNPTENDAIYVASADGETWDLMYQHPQTGWQIDKLNAFQGTFDQVNVLIGKFFAGIE